VLKSRISIKKGSVIFSTICEWTKKTVPGCIYYNSFWIF